MAIPTDAPALVAAARAGSARAVARLLTWVERGGTDAAEVAAAIREAPAGPAGDVVVVGLTGPPGVGKSTTTAALIAAARGLDRRVAVLAVDPSSPFSGGALLGDRVRMADHATDPGVFIRSMSSRGRLGGLSAATPGAVDLLGAIGFDLVLVETVGVGQNEVDVMRLADTVVVVVAPGMGDGVQAAKAGILEIADLLVVNKSDREGAAATMRELRSMVALGRSGTAAPGDWRIPVLSTVAVTGTGIDELVTAIDAHHRQLADTGELHHRRRQRAAAGIVALVTDRVERALASVAGRHRVEAAAADVAAGAGDPFAAAGELLDWVASDPEPDPDAELRQRNRPGSVPVAPA